MIRNNDPKLKEVKDDLFKDEDFEAEEDGKTKNRKEKKLTYKDQIREDVLKGNVADDSSEDENGFIKKQKGKETIAEEEQRLKKEFKKAAKVDEDQDEDEDQSEDDFLQKKSKDEDELPENIETIELKDILKNKKKKREMRLVNDEDVLRRFYGNDQ